MEITKKSLTQFRAEFKETVKVLEEKHGIKISLGGITFDEDGFRSKFTVLNVNKGDEGKSSHVLQMEKDFRENAQYFGLKESDLGKTFERGSDTFTIRGLKPKSHKYPFIVQKGDDTETLYKFEERVVVGGLKGETNKLTQTAPPK